MNRNDAERALRDTSLPMAETLVMLWLLTRSNWADCALPSQFTPAMPELANWTRVNPRHLRRLLAHLQQHGWIDRTPGRGRGSKSTYLLQRVSPATARKGDTQTPFCRQ